MARDFGLFRCPFFIAEILEVSQEEYVLSKLRCYTKKVPTILTSSKKPTQIHQHALNPSDILPPTVMSSGSGHQRKPMGVEKPLFHLEEVPEITEKRDLSTLLPWK